MPLKLTLFPLGRPGRQVVLEEGRAYRLGRSPDTDIVASDPRVSFTHLHIDGLHDRWQLTDQASKNGTRIDGRPLDRAVLERRAWLSIGGMPALAEPQTAQAVRRDTRTRERRIAVAAAAGAGLQTRRTTRTLLKHCLDAFVQLSGCERASIWVADDASAVRPVALRGPASPGPSRRLIAEVAATGECRVVSDTAGAEMLARKTSDEQSGIRALVALPLEALQRRIGVLYADSRRQGKTFTELDLELLSGFAAQAALTLAAARARDELDELAGDPLRL